MPKGEASGNLAPLGCTCCPDPIQLPRLHLQPHQNRFFIKFSRSCARTWFKARPQEPSGLARRCDMDGSPEKRESKVVELPAASDHSPGCCTPQAPRCKKSPNALWAMAGSPPMRLDIAVFRLVAPGAGHPSLTLELLIEVHILLCLKHGRPLSKCMGQSLSCNTGLNK